MTRHATGETSMIYNTYELYNTVHTHPVTVTLCVPRQNVRSTYVYHWKPGGRDCIRPDPCITVTVFEEWTVKLYKAWHQLHDLIFFTLPAKINQDQTNQKKYPIYLTCLYHFDKVLYYLTDMFVLSALFLIFFSSEWGPIAPSVEPWTLDCRVPNFEPHSGRQIAFLGKLLYPYCSNSWNRRCFSNMALNLEAEYQAYANKNCMRLGKSERKKKKDFIRIILLHFILNDNLLYNMQ